MSTAAAAEPPVGVPVYDAGMWQAFRRFWKGYVRFSGRASRAEYWWAQVPLAIISLVVSLASVAIMFGAVLVPILGTMATGSTEDVGWFVSTMLASFGLMLVAMLPLLVFSFAIALPSYAITYRRLNDAGFPPLLVLLSLVGLSIVPVIMCIMPTKPEGYVPASQRPAPMGAAQPQAPQPYQTPQPYQPSQAPQR